MTAGGVRTPLLVTGPDGPLPARGRDLGRLRTFADGVLAWDDDGAVTYAGPANGAPASAEPVDGAVVPGFVDCHTHLPFRGWRSDEFEARLAGRSYRDVQGGGGGIFRSARLLAESSDDEVVAFCRPLLGEMLRHGTTTCELKTGYGLSVEAELRQARVARAIAGQIEQTATVTLLACHAVPPEMDRTTWVRQVCEELIPAAAAEGLADMVDVYVEDIAFSVQDFERVAQAATDHGLGVRCHADQLGHSAAAEAAVAAGARSADHLNNTGPEGIAALGEGRTVAVLLPVSTLFLRADPPPVDALLDAGAAVALATDFNPGTSPCLSMPEVMSVAASLYRLEPAAALVAATANAAFVLGLEDRVGTLDVGKRADFVVLDAPEVAMLAYRPGHDPVGQTWIGGRLVYRTET